MENNLIPNPNPNHNPKQNEQPSSLLLSSQMNSTVIQTEIDDHDNNLECPPNMPIATRTRSANSNPDTNLLQSNINNFQNINNNNYHINYSSNQYQSSNSYSFNRQGS